MRNLKFNLFVILLWLAPGVARAADVPVPEVRNPSSGLGFAVNASVGTWYSDDFGTAWIYGGGILVRPCLSWLEISLSYETGIAKVASTDPLYAALDGDQIGTLVTGFTFPEMLQVFGRRGFLYPLVGHVLTLHGGRTAHAMALGGGLEVQFWDGRFALRAEVRDLLFQKIPFSGGKTTHQEDLHFLLRVVARLWR